MHRVQWLGGGTDDSSKALLLERASHCTMHLLAFLRIYGSCSDKGNNRTTNLGLQCVREGALFLDRARNGCND